MANHRRKFITGLGAAAAVAVTGPLSLAVRAAMGPNDKYDLVIKGGDLLDPSVSLRKKADIGIRFGKIEAIENDIPAARATRLLDASGRMVIPGLVDLHAHVFPYGSAIGIPADELIPLQGTTTMVSAGDAGANNFAAFRRYVIGHTRTRLYAFVHIANIGLAGFPEPELYHLGFAQPEAAGRTVAENADIALGVKVRMSENVVNQAGIEPVKRSVRACEIAGDGARVMCHIGGVATSALMSEILDTLRRGDILTHCYSGATNLAGKFTNIVQDGKLLPAAAEAKKRGVIFDIGHGGGSFDFTIAEAAMQAGVMPDTISSDIHVFSGNSPGMPYLTWVMSKFMALGFSLEKVIQMATAVPAGIINRTPKLGTLQVGAPADATVIEIVRGDVEFVDTRDNKRKGTAWIKPIQTVLGGVPWGRPYMSPFSVR